MNAELHGYWGLENAKSRLHQYLQMNKINATYKFQSTGPDNQKYAYFSCKTPQKMLIFNNLKHF